MAKKCMICGKEAKFCIKDRPECYCAECAEENFADIGYLQKIEEDARKLQKIIEDKIDANSDD